MLHLGKISTDLENTEIHLNQEEGTAEFLKRVIHYLTPNGEFLTHGEEMTQRFIVTYSPMIILRNKNSGIIEYLDKSMDAIQNGLEIPPHLVDLLHPKNKVSDIHEKVETLEKRLAAASGEAPEIFMTKPANKAQLRIAQDIEQNNAVEVQGPPGTGKTHTIANLIGHFLAQGKTVLVTSEKIKALSVLRDKLDEEIRPLCVPVFDGNQSEMNDIISSISAKVNVVNIRVCQEWNQRQVVVGNAASFQGDERDVMFLSMVDDDESANRSRTKLDLRRRYNVAASRAKDQLWVVNSLDYTKLKHGENLEDEDVRFGLLEYAENYQEHRARFLEAEVKAESL